MMARKYQNNTKHYHAVRNLLLEIRDAMSGAHPERAEEIDSLLDQLTSRLFRVAIVATTSTGKQALVNHCAIEQGRLSPVVAQLQTK